MIFESPGLAKRHNGILSGHPWVHQIQGVTTRNRFRLLAIVPILIAALTAPGQQTVTQGGVTYKQERSQPGPQDQLPPVEAQLKVLTEQLDLSGNQQAKVKLILQKLHDRTEKLIKNENLSNENRLAQVRPERCKAEKQIRELLTAHQKTILDVYLHGPHDEIHGSLSGKSASPGKQPQN